MSTTTVTISVTNLSDLPFQATSAPLNNASWSENPVGSVINVEATKPYSATGEDPFSGSLVFLYSFSAQSTLSVNFTFSGGVLTYSCDLPSTLTDRGSSVSGLTANVSIGPA